MAESSVRPFDLVLFDLDGTLVATAGELADALNDALLQFDLSPINVSQVEGWIGHGTRELVVRALAHAAMGSVEAIRGSTALHPVLRAFDECYLKRNGTCSQVYPGVHYVLRELRRRGVKLAVLTNKDSRFTGPLLAAHGLAQFFDSVVSGDTMGAKKPAPDGLLYCLKRLQVAAERALFVGDSSIDVATARNAGVRIWALPNGYNQGQAIAASNPDRVIDDLRALIA